MQVYSRFVLVLTLEPAAVPTVITINTVLCSASSTVHNLLYIHRIIKNMSMLSGYPTVREVTRWLGMLTKGTVIALTEDSF